MLEVAYWSLGEGQDGVGDLDVLLREDGLAGRVVVTQIRVGLAEKAREARNKLRGLLRGEAALSLCKSRGGDGDKHRGGSEELHCGLSCLKRVDGS